MGRLLPSPGGFLLLFLLPAGCASPYYEKIPRRPPFPLPRAGETLAALRDPQGPPLVVAHRGGHAWAPENTIQGILAAWRMGIPMVEVDVRSTADGVPVLLHDSRLDRTTGSGGEVRSLPFRKVEKARIPYRKGMPGLRVPSLARALRAARGKVVLVLDLKQVETDRLLAVLEREDSLGKALILVHRKKQMEELERDRRRPGLLLAVRAGSAGQALAFQRAFHPAVVHVSPGFLSPALAAELRQGGSRVWVNAFQGPDRTGRLEDYISLVGRGADIIQTDRPLLALRALAALPARVGAGAGVPRRPRGRSSAEDPGQGTGWTEKPSSEGRPVGTRVRPEGLRVKSLLSCSGS